VLVFGEILILRKRIMVNDESTDNDPSWLAKTYAEIYEDLGNRCLADGQIDRAIAYFTKAIRLRPDFDRAYVDRGLCYFKKGQVGRARKDICSAIRLNPSEAEARHLEALIKLNLGD
jgi:Flp pilus assembly protein TadD